MAFFHAIFSIFTILNYLNLTHNISIATPRHGAQDEGQKG